MTLCPQTTTVERKNIQEIGEQRKWRIMKMMKMNVDKEEEEDENKL